MEEKLYAILDEQHCFYCYMILESNLDDSQINKKIKNLYFDLLEEDEEFSDYFEYKLKQLKNIKVKSIVYKDMKYICV